MTLQAMLAAKTANAAANKKSLQTAAQDATIDPPKKPSLPSLLDLANSVNRAKARGHMSMLLYGAAKTGKTSLAATMARLDYLERIWWFDLENGLDAVVLAFQAGRLTAEQIAKIIPIRVADTKQSPMATETILKSLCGRKPVYLDPATGKAHDKMADGLVEFDISKLTDKDLIVIDSLSQFGQSNLNAATLGKPSEYKLQLDDYGAAQKWGYDLLTTVQAAQYCHFLCITHVRMSEDEVGRTIITPLMGSSTTSANVAKHFNTVVYLEKNLKSIKTTSSALGSVTAQAGSRVGITLDAEKDPCLAKALANVSYFPANTSDEA